MKIAVYTIAKNEERFVERWAMSAQDADHLAILDTGSTDKTVENAQELGVNVSVKVFDPWRFDSARNAALAALPDDIDMCIALDMDEVLVEGWREKLEGVARGVTRPRYKYVWSWNSDGSEGLVYGGDKIHARHRYVWRHPVHEVLSVLDGSEVQQWVSGLEIHHHPDPNKSRSQYLPLLELAVREDPNDDRNRFYLGREYFFNGAYPLAEEQFRAHLALSVWAPERAASCRYMARMKPEEAEGWLFRALHEDRFRRETWVDLAKFYYENRDFEGCYWASTRAIGLVDKPLDYLCEAYAWGELPYDLAAISAYSLGFYGDAVKFGRKALGFSPEDPRLLENVRFYDAAFPENGLGIRNEKGISDE